MKTDNTSKHLENWVLAPEAPRSETMPSIIAPSTVERKQPKRVLIAYKVVRIINNRLYSLIDGKNEGRMVEYIIGQEMREPAKTNHGGGFYVHVANNVMHIYEKFKSGELIPLIDTNTDYGIIECEVAPPFVFYNADGYSISPNSDMARLKKISVSWLLPIRFHGSFSYGQHNGERARSVPSQPIPAAYKHNMSYAEQLNAKWGHLKEW